MKSQGQDVSVKSISSYLGYFKDAYLLSSVDRYDIHGKKLLESNEKLYLGDVGLRNLIAGGEREGDIEKIMENIVYQQLLRMGYTVSVGQLRAGEVDFVCTQSNKRIYVQVAYLIASPETEERAIIKPAAPNLASFPKPCCAVPFRKVSTPSFLFFFIVF